MSIGFICYVSGRTDPTHFFYNMVVSFDAPPALAVLKEVVEDRVLQDDCVSDGSQFFIGDFEILDFRVGMWVTLESKNQLYSGCQLNALRSVGSSSAAGMVDRAYKPNGERVLRFAVEAQSLFEVLDTEDTGEIRLPSFLKVFRANVDFAIEAFTQLDRKLAGFIKYRDFLLMTKEPEMSEFFRELRVRIETQGKRVKYHSDRDVQRRKKDKKRKESRKRGGDDGDDDEYDGRERSSKKDKKGKKQRGGGENTKMDDSIDGAGEGLTSFRKASGDDTQQQQGGGDKLVSLSGSLANTLNSLQQQHQGGSGAGNGAATYFPTYGGSGLPIGGQQLSYPQQQQQQFQNNNSIAGMTNFAQLDLHQQQNYLMQQHHQQQQQQQAFQQQQLMNNIPFAGPYGQYLTAANNNGGGGNSNNNTNYLPDSSSLGASRNGQQQKGGTSGGSSPRVSPRPAAESSSPPPLSKRDKAKAQSVIDILQTSAAKRKTADELRRAKREGEDEKGAINRLLLNKLKQRREQKKLEK